MYMTNYPLHTWYKLYKLVKAGNSSQSTRLFESRLSVSYSSWGRPKKQCKTIIHTLSSNNNGVNLLSGFDWLKSQLDFFLFPVRMSQTSSALLTCRRSWSCLPLTLLMLSLPLGATWSTVPALSWWVTLSGLKHLCSAVLLIQGGELICNWWT